MNANTTISISKKYDKILVRLCTTNKCTKKDFVAAAIMYLEKYGINPVSHESPSQEMQKLIRRVDQVIAFIRQQEKEILRPACEAIFTSEERIKQNLFTLVKKEDLSNLQYLSSGISETQNMIMKIMTAQEEGFKILSRLIDAKEKTGVFNDISKAYNQP